MRVFLRLYWAQREESSWNGPLTDGPRSGIADPARETTRQRPGSTTVEEEGVEMRRRLLLAFVLAITLSFLVDRCRFSANWTGSTPPDPIAPGSGLPASAAVTLCSGKAVLDCDTAFSVGRMDETPRGFAALAHPKGMLSQKGLVQCAVMAQGY